MIICIKCRSEVTPDHKTPCQPRAQRTGPSWLLEQAEASARRLDETPTSLLDPIGRELQAIARIILDDLEF